MGRLCDVGIGLLLSGLKNSMDLVYAYARQHDGMLHHGFAYVAPSRKHMSNIVMRRA